MGTAGWRRLPLARLKPERNFRHSARCWMCVNDAALAVLQETGMLAGTMAVLGGRIDAALNRRVPEGGKPALSALQMRRDCAACWQRAKTQMN